MPWDRENRPVACTLAAEEHTARVKWIEELNSAALVGFQRDGQQVRLSYRPDAAAQARELVRRERLCCPFLQLRTAEDQGAFTVTIDAPSEFGRATDVLFAPYNGSE